MQQAQLPEVTCLTCEVTWLNFFAADAGLDIHVL